MLKRWLTLATTTPASTEGSAADRLQVLARKGRAGQVPKGWHGLMLGPQGQVLKYVTEGTQLKQAGGSDIWWVNAAPCWLTYRPQAQPDVSFRFYGKMVKPDSGDEGALLALAGRLQRCREQKLDAWLQTSLEEGLALGRHWRLWVPPLLQGDEVSRVCSLARRFLAGYCGFVLQPECLEQPVPIAVDYANRVVDGQAESADCALEPTQSAPAEPDDIPRLSRRQAGMLRDEDASLAFRLFRQLPDHAGDLRARVCALDWPDDWYAQWQRLDAVARLGRFAEPGGVDSQAAPVVLQQCVKALWRACESMDALGDALQMPHDGAPDLARVTALIQSIEANINYRHALAHDSEQAVWAEPVDVAAPTPHSVAESMPLSAPPAPSGARDEAQVEVHLGGRCSVRLVSRSLPDREPGGVRFLPTPLLDRSALKRLHELLIRVRAEEPTSPDLPVSVAISLEAEGNSAQALSARMLEFPLVLLDNMMRGRLGPMPDRIHCLPLRLNASAHNQRLNRLVFAGGDMRQCLDDIERELQANPGQPVFLMPTEDADANTSIHKLRALASSVHQPASFFEFHGQCLTNEQGVATATVHFPLVQMAGQPAQLADISLRLLPIENAATPGFYLAGGTSAQQVRLGQLLGSIRSAEADTRQWTTQVAFSASVSGNSWELAAVLADRLARGTLHPPAGRLMATGRVLLCAGDCAADETYEALNVGNVNGMLEKLDGMAQLARNGDRMVVPADWKQAASAFHARLIAAGALMVSLERADWQSL